jgi:hypothetical protein
MKYTIKEVAKILGITPAGVYAAIKAKKLKARKIRAQTTWSLYVVDSAELARYQMK